MMLLSKSLVVLVIILGSLSCEGRAGKNNLDEEDVSSNPSKRIKIENLLNSPEDASHLFLPYIEQSLSVLTTLSENDPRRVQEVSKLIQTINSLDPNFRDFKNFLKNFSNKGPGYELIRISIITKYLQHTDFLKRQLAPDRINNLLDLAKFLPIRHPYRHFIVSLTLLNQKEPFSLLRTIKFSLPECQEFIPLIIEIAQNVLNPSLRLKAAELLPEQHEARINAAIWIIWNVNDLSLVLKASKLLPEQHEGRINAAIWIIRNVRDPSSILKAAKLLTEQHEDRINAAIWIMQNVDDQSLRLKAAELLPNSNKKE
jgi:hypothetical protein